MNAKEVIARRVALEFRDGDVVNLGFGIPNYSADFIPEGVNVILQAENGALRLVKHQLKKTTIQTWQTLVVHRLRYFLVQQPLISKHPSQLFVVVMLMRQF